KGKLLGRLSSKLMAESVEKLLLLISILTQYANFAQNDI
ncbi:MAG: hypothetical protein UT01_C0075G0001, partial [Candidatus Daviesbacteria bacterium GW2011_GWA1_38_7]